MSLLNLMSAATSPGRAGDRRIYGVVVGIVKDINDPRGLGRVKVDFPWLAEDSDTTSPDDQEERSHSFWARIATLMAGSGRGSFFIPEIGDEVLVAFEHGDINYPFVLGSLWNSEDTPPETMDSDSKNHIRAIHTRSGHVVSFDDNTDDKAAAIRITSQGGHSVTLDDASGTGNITVKTAGGHAITLDDEGGTVTMEDSAGNKLCFDANAGSLTVDTSGNQALNSQGNIDIKVTGSATIAATSGITLDSTSVKLGQGASMTLVNDSFLTAFNTHMHTGNMGAPTTPPLVPAIPNVHSTMFTKGA
ncbi:MAG: phage baseplate assembly protein V [Desulfobacteraceae bacterium]|jgi:uncharacterized protein involved in type VI secretion and phage assembly